MHCTKLRLTVLLLLGALANLAAASSLCGFPGRDGAATADGVINLWLDPGDGAEAKPGEKQLPVVGRRGVGDLQSGDVLLLVQMQGADIDSSNDVHYGAGQRDTAGRGMRDLHAGHFELVRVEAVAAEGVRIRGDGANGGVRHHYINREPQQVADPGRARWQMVRVPQYERLTLSGDLRVLPWDGRSGGVLALDVRQQLDLNGHGLNAVGSGFRGGAALPLIGGLGDMSDFAHRAPAADELAVGFGQHASKGEGLAGTPRWLIQGDQRIDSRPQADRLTVSDGYPAGSMGRGAPGNAGGGANSLRPDNKPPAGGGGGAGGLAGATGLTYQGEPEGGLAGTAVPVSALRLIAGGGGGAGTRSKAAELLAGSGGAGGGIVVLRVGRLQGDGFIDVSAGTVPAAVEGGGGGGGAGTILLQAPFSDPGRRQWRLAGAAGALGDAAGGAGGAGRMLIGGGLARPPALQPEQTPVRDDILRQQVAGVAPGYLCRPTGMLIGGLLFEDNGLADGIAHDGRRQGGERGLAARQVRVVATADQRLLVETTTNGAGLFALNLPESLAGQSVQLQVSVPSGWLPVAASAEDLPLAPVTWQGVEAGQASWQFTVQREYFQDGIRLALVRAPHWETPQARQVAPGSTQLFLFRYQPFTEGRVRFRYRSDAAAAPNWQHRFLIDPQCNDASQYLDQTVSRWLPVSAGKPVCVRVRVEVPAGAAAMGQLGLLLEAETELGDTPLNTRLPPLQSPIMIRLAP